MKEDEPQGQADLGLNLSSVFVPCDFGPDDIASLTLNSLSS